MLDDIKIYSDMESGVLTLTITVGNEQTTVLQETLYTDLDSMIVISDLPALIEPYARQYGRLSLGGSFTDDDGTVSLTPVTVLFGLVDVGDTAASFTQSHFLTILDGEKLTAYRREERLYAYDADEVTVNAEIRLPTGVFATRTIVLQASSTVDDISQFDVSPNVIADALNLVGSRLLCYSVEAGSRRQVFRVIEEVRPPEPSLLFVNSFGCEEFLHCCGTLKRSSKYERKSARIRQQLRNYRITEERQFSANTGWLNDAMADWADDLFRSEEVFLWENRTRGREVLISDSKDELTNEDDYMTAYEFTYTYVQRVHNVLQRRTAMRIFSEQFEDIYN